jgi:hypothetical protein
MKNSSIFSALSEALIKRSAPQAQRSSSAALIKRSAHQAQRSSVLSGEMRNYFYRDEYYQKPNDNYERLPPC